LKVFRSHECERDYPGKQRKSIVGRHTHKRWRITQECGECGKIGIGERTRGKENRFYVLLGGVLWQNFYTDQVIITERMVGYSIKDTALTLPRHVRLY